MPQPRKLHDRYFKQAKEEGYVARSAYKLLEINEKRRLVRAGDRVLDLGSAPGSWLQVLDERLGPRGRITGIDLQEVDAPRSERVRVLRGDAFLTSPEVLLGAWGEPDPPRFDVVLSDMAPNTTGHGDDFLSARLCERVLDLCAGVLRPGGNLIMKILEGEPTPGVIARTKRLFIQAGTTKPAASRDLSREIFIWGTGYVGERGNAGPASATGAREERGAGDGAGRDGGGARGRPRR
ncbi:MAG: RlmE family RNA methyltransferase [Planctomycetota bacterium]|nr:RlmE family RNA methyltransferase [Planctomycetota bacterium]